MPAERTSPNLDDAKFRAALARHLEITPTEREQAHSFGTSASIRFPRTCGDRPGPPAPPCPSLSVPPHLRG